MGHATPLPMSGEPKLSSTQHSALSPQHSGRHTPSPLTHPSCPVHNNLRISTTDRCNLRCTYCMPEDVVFMDRSELLTFEEMTRFVGVAAPLGLDKVRLPGGGPPTR